MLHACWNCNVCMNSCGAYMVFGVFFADASVATLAFQ